MTREALAKIAKHAKELNEEADRVSKGIEATNEHLRKAGVGLTLWGQCIEERTKSEYNEQTETTYPYTHRLFLGYAKTTRDTWELATHWDTVDADDVVVDVKRPEPLEQAEREIRIKAARILDDFLDSLAKTLERRTAELKLAMK